LLHATAAAEILIAGNKQILKLCNDVLTAAQSANTVPLLPLRLGFSSFVDHDLYEMVCSMHKALFPSCEIVSQSGDPVDLLLMLEHGEIDAALVTLPASGAGLTAHQFTQSRLVVCMRADDPLSKLKEITPADLGTKLTIFREPKQHPEAHERLMEMLDVVGIGRDIVRANKTPNDIQWMVESGGGFALIPEGSPLQVGLVTRPIAGVTWTVDSALIVGRSKSQKTLPRLVKELRRRFRAVAKLPPAKPVRSVRPSISSKTLPLFG
jgi:DNA-binding transcriptional LysR family regulator